MCFFQSKTTVHKSANSFQFSKCDDCGDTYANLETKYNAKIANFTKEETLAVAKAKADAAAKAAAKGTSGKGSSGGSGTPPITHAYPYALHPKMPHPYPKMPSVVKPILSFSIVIWFHTSSRALEIRVGVRTLP